MLGPWGHLKYMASPPWKTSKVCYDSKALSSLHVHFQHATAFSLQTEGDAFFSPRNHRFCESQ